MWPLQRRGPCHMRTRSNLVSRWHARLNLFFMLLWLVMPIRTRAATSWQDSGAARNVQFADTNCEKNNINGEDDFGYIEGMVTWDPPVDVEYSGETVSRYYVYIYWNEQGENPGWLVGFDEEADSEYYWADYGTNRLNMYEETDRIYSYHGDCCNYPAQWLAVHTYFDSFGMQPIDYAGKTRLYDCTPEPPALFSFDSFNFTDADPEANKVEGLVQWVPPNGPANDFAYTQQYALYFAEDAFGANRHFIDTVPVGTNLLELLAGTDCGSANFVLLYQMNSNGDSAKYQHMYFVDLGRFYEQPGTRTKTSTTVSITVTATTTTTTLILAGGDHAIMDLAWEDTNDEEYVIGGTVTWSPPAAAASDTITHFVVFIAADEHGTDQVELWDQNDEMDTFQPLIYFGTNKMFIADGTGRATRLHAPFTDPANWLLVYGYRQNIQGYFPISNAGKLRIYDRSVRLPNKIPMNSVTFANTDSTLYEIGGIFEWSPATRSDFGFTHNYSVYLSSDGISRDSLVGSVPVGTNQMIIDADRSCLDRPYLVLYGCNPNGYATDADSVFVSDCQTTKTTTVTTTMTLEGTFTSVTSTTATSTSATVTVTTATTTTLTTTVPVGFDAHAIMDLMWEDTNDEEYVIGGTVTWKPPWSATADTITHFVIFIAADEHGTDQVELWDQNNEKDTFQIEVYAGTNKMFISEGTGRATGGNDPANWLLVYGYRQNIGGFFPISNAGKLRIYDRSHRLPNKIPMDHIVFANADETLYEIGGILSWSPAGKPDYGFTRNYSVYMSSDGRARDTLVGYVPVGTNQMTIDADRTCLDKPFLVLYGVNPNGHATDADAVFVPGCQSTTTSTSATLTTTTQTDGTTTLIGTSSTTPLVETKPSGITFVDVASDDFVIGGFVTWIPPADTSEIQWYQAYVSYDASGYGQGLLWNTDPDTSDYHDVSYVPVGTNVHYVPTDTARKTTTSFPANYVIVYASMGGIGNIANAGSVAIYDYTSSRTPDKPDFSSLTFDGTNVAEGIVSGKLRWSYKAGADIGFTTHHVVYLARDVAGSNRNANSIAVAFMGTNEIAIPSQTLCGNNNYLLVYAKNPNGEGHSAYSTPLTHCALLVTISATDTTTTTGTTIVTTATTATSVTTTSQVNSNTTVPFARRLRGPGSLDSVVLPCPSAKQTGGI